MASDADFVRFSAPDLAVAWWSHNLWDFQLMKLCGLTAKRSWLSKRVIRNADSDNSAGIHQIRPNQAYDPGKSSTSRGWPTARRTERLFTPFNSTQFRQRNAPCQPILKFALCRLRVCLAQRCLEQR